MRTPRSMLKPKMKKDYAAADVVDAELLQPLLLEYEKSEEDCEPTRVSLQWRDDASPTENEQQKPLDLEERGRRICQPAG